MRLGVDLVNTPHWEVFVGVELDLGVIVQVRTMLWTKTFPDKKFDGLLAWKMILASDVGITSLYPETGPAGTEVTISGYGFGNTRENDSFIKFGGMSAEEYTSWSDKSIKCKVPAGVTETVEVKVTHIFHKWGPVTIEVTSNTKPFTVPGGGVGSGGGWEVQLSGVETLNGVDALDAGHAWAVQAGGTILHYDGSTWSMITGVPPNDDYPTDVWVKDANNLWVLGVNLY